ncbi:membrane protein [Acetobacter oeni]|uniref:Membrane protein n=2 Tax=Acetobacter oeni TaxID=304077 RepID=A0A511XGT7_9PROT|nr:hypothetical protein AA21952_1917 [Acetobacter oeni LMG 21952]GEN62167.1 membrane protein [Acetobacter oeni]
MSSFACNMAALRQLRAARSGSVIAIAAVSLVPLIIGIAATVDLGMIINTRSKLQDMADAASLLAAKAASTYLVEENTSSTSAGAQSTAQTAAVASITTNAANAGVAVPTSQVTYTATTAYSGTVTVALSQTTNLLFSGFLSSGANTISVSSTATTTEGNAYIQVIFVVDISNSMGVGGTAAAISSLESGIGQCAFACHDPNGYSVATISCTTKTSSGRHQSTLAPCDMRAEAKTEGIDLKIDYVNEAIQDFITQLTEYAQNDTTHIKVGIDTFGTSFTQMLAPTTDLSTAATDAASIDLEAATPLANAQDNPNSSSTNYSTYNYGYTKTTAALTQAIAGLSGVGDGSSATSMKTYIVFLSDGVEDIYGTTPWHRSIDLSYTSLCTTLQNMGVKIFSIWAPYYAIPNDNQYDTLIAPIAGTGSGTMQGAMQSCATSSDTYFQADDGPAIQSAVASTFDTILEDSSLRITQ